MKNDKIIARAVGVILSGTVLSQVINLSSLPLLTRIFSPDDFGVLSIFVSIMTICLSISSLKFEMAIPVQTSRLKATNVFTLGLTVTVLTSLISFIFLYFFQTRTDLIFLEDYFYFIPIGVFIGGIYQLLNYYAVFERDYKGISISKIIQSSSSVIIQIITGAIWASPIALLVGYIVNLGGGIFYLKKRLNLFGWHKISLSNLKQTFVENKKFPKYTVLESLANTLGLQLPLIIIAYYLGLSEVGYLFLAIKIFQAPIGLISASVSQVFFSKSNEPKNDEEIAKLVEDILIFLIKIGVSSTLILVALMYSLIDIVFGETWTKVSYYVVLLAPWFIMQLIVSPISTVMYTKGYNKKYMAITVYGLFFKIGLFLFINLIIGKDYLIVALVYLNSLFYIFCFYTFLKASNFTTGNCRSVISNSYLFIMLSVSVSVVLFTLKIYL